MGAKDGYNGKGDEPAQFAMVRTPGWQWWPQKRVVRAEGG